MRRVLIASALALACAAAGVSRAQPAGGASPAGDAESGREVYGTQCRACHSSAIAPTLKGVVGRPVASVAGYAYSDALKSKTPASWTQETLDAFLTNPQAYAPGTKMPLAVADPQKRADVIAFLKVMNDES